MSRSEITVASFNVASKAKSWQRTSWPRRLSFIRATIYACRMDWVGSTLGHTRVPDVVAIQEGGSLKPQIAQLDAELAKLKYKRVPKGGKWRYLYYQPSRFAVEQSGLIVLNALRTRGTAWAILRELSTGKRVFVTSTHLPQGWASTDRLRYSEERKMLAAAARLNPGKHPTIHAGDLNSYGLVSKQVLTPAGFPDTLDKARWARGGSYDSFNGRTTVSAPPPSVPYPRHGNHFDHIAATAGLIINRWLQVPAREASDHNAIVAQVVLP